MTPIMTPDAVADNAECRTTVAARQLHLLLTAQLPFWRRPKPIQKFNAPSRQRRADSLNEQPLEPRDDVLTQLQKSDAKKTIFYLAYGSNLSAETFLGRRGIKPLGAVNVVVPSLRLTFDLPGIPYTEPCFANSGMRDANNPPSPDSTVLTEKSALLSIVPTDKPRYHKDRWYKGLVGVAYELTLSDFAHVIATEGGGASYQDVLVDCFPLEPGTSIVPDEPTSDPFKAHTLFAPAAPPPSKPGEKLTRAPTGRFQRPDPSYAQPSARYLKLISDGAQEHEMPREYREYLAQIRPYTITTNKQRLGQFIFLAVLGPILMAVVKLSPLFADKNGRSPKWVRELMATIFTVLWRSYDSWFEPLFGDGERTVGQ